MAAQYTWSELMDKFHANDDSRIQYSALLDVNQISKELDIAKGKFWQKLIDYLTNEGQAGYLGQNYFRKGNFPSPLPGDEGVDSLLKYIKDNIDFPDSFNDSIMEAYKSKTTPTNTYYWNESTNDLIKYILNSFDFNYNPDPGDADTIVVDENNSFSIDKIKNADAGNSFELNQHWVESWTNASGQSYAEVRDVDIEPLAITNDNYLQYTNESSMRLLLPEYKRNVEVEDLNRNFWVIGQSLAGISAYLFSEDSPFINTFEGIIKEVVDLWENVLYLWLAFAISIQEKDYYTEIHQEVVYLSANDFQTEFKYDGFDGSGLDLTLLNGGNAENYNSLIAAIQGKIDYLKAKYPHCHLCIIPVIRADNYEHNYYSTEFYPGVFLFDRNQDADWRFVSFKTNSTNGLITLMSVGSGADQKYAAPAKQLTPPSAIGFTYNRKNDIYYSPFAGAGINSASTALNGQGYDAILDSTTSPKTFNYFGAEDTSMTFYSTVRTVISPNPSTGKFYHYNENASGDKLTFDQFILYFYTPKYTSLADLIAVDFYMIQWIRNGNSIVVNEETIESGIEPNYSTIAKETSGGIATNWPFYGLSGTTVINESSIQIPDVLSITGSNGFYMGEIMSKKLGFFKQIYED